MIFRPQQYLCECRVGHTDRWGEGSLSINVKSHTKSNKFSDLGDVLGRFGLPGLPEKLSSWTLDLGTRIQYPGPGSGDQGPNSWIKDPGFVMIPEPASRIQDPASRLSQNQILTYLNVSFPFFFTFLGPAPRPRPQSGGGPGPLPLLWGLGLGPSM